MHKLGALANLPVEVEGEEDGQADVSSNENINVPFARQEDLEAIKKGNERDEEDTEVSRVRLEGCLVWQRVAVNSVVFEPVVEARVGDKDDVPGNETRNR